MRLASGSIAGVAAAGFVPAPFFASACDAGRGDLAGGGLGGGGSRISVWGGVEAGPECQVGFGEWARLEGVGGLVFDPSCAPTAVVTARRYNPAAAKASQLEALMRSMRVIRHRCGGALAPCHFRRSIFNPPLLCASTGCLT